MYTIALVQDPLTLLSNIWMDSMLWWTSCLTRDLPLRHIEEHTDIVTQQQVATDDLRFLLYEEDRRMDDNYFTFYLWQWLLNIFGLPSIAICVVSFLMDTTKQTPWPLIRKRTIPTERPPLVDEI
jgi:hypothetical protein